MNNGQAVYNPKLQAHKAGDLVVLIFTLIISSLIVLVLGGLQVLFILLFITVLVLFYIRLQQINILSNSLRVQNGRHAELAKMANEYASMLNLPPIDIYITQNPVLNAYALGYGRPFTIVINSSVIEELTTEEIRAILLHEIGHIVYHHTILTSYIGPLATTVPIAGPVLNWIFGFWYRRAELTCDRFAVTVLKDPHAVCMALIKVHVGSKFAKYMQEEGVLYQSRLGRGVTRAISQSLSTHPFLVTRIDEILGYCSRNQITIPQHVIDYANGTAKSQSV
jgi:Zn-dependent protease with chaperone function